MTRAELLKTAKPIFFETELVQNILDDRKTVTRRICKDGNEYTVPDMSFFDAKKRTYAVHNYADLGHMEKLSIAERTCQICTGDILYVRETWKIHSLNPAFCMMIRYKADNFCDIQVKFSPSRFDKFQKFHEKNGWQSPYFMPKEAARIFLKVTDVRVERLQDMETVDDRNYVSEGAKDKHDFIRIWDATVKDKEKYEKYGWYANPWVWVIEFERIYPDEFDGKVKEIGK